MGDALGAVLGALVAVVVFLVGANTFGRPARGSRPARPERPADPPRPDTSADDRAAAVADHEADRTREDVDAALTGVRDGGARHGLADVVNRRRR